MNDVYARLREFLDTFPGGYPPTPTGVEIKILKKLFSPEDAELFLRLNKEPEALPAIAERLGRDEGEVGEELEDMAKRGLIFRNRVGDKVLYRAYQFFVGIVEAQIDRVDPELTQLIDEYFPTLGAAGLTLETKQMRVIPAGTAVDEKTTVASYNRIREIISDEELIAVAPCICTQMAETRGNKCEHTIERCLAFGEMAQYYIDNGIARKISKDELMKLLDAVEQEGLVLCTSNTEKLLFTCCCCPCCCGVVQGIKLLPQASLMANICYNAKIDPELCIQCGDCVDRCPMDAIAEGDETVAVSADKCVGCGVCVSVCPEEAIALTEVATGTKPFPGHEQMYASVSKERGLA
jgi:NAD-dependent dihydropyrimidine dehydrogenase PreA subunit